MLNYQELKTKLKELWATTGLKAEEFEALLTVFAESYEERYPADRTVNGQVRQRRKGGATRASWIG